MNRVFALAALAALASTPAFAGKDPCPGVSQKKDAFGVTRSFEVGSLKAIRSGDTTTLVVSINSGGGYGGFSSSGATLVGAGTPVQLMMADDTLLDLASTAAVGPTFVNIMGIMVAYIPFPIQLTPEQIAALSAQPIKAARSDAGGKSISTEIKGKDGQKFQETFTCLTTTSL